MSKTNNQQDIIFSESMNYDIKPILDKIDNNNSLTEELLQALQNISASMQNIESTQVTDVMAKIDVSGESNVTSLTDKLNKLLNTFQKINTTIATFNNMKSLLDFGNIGERISVYTFQN